MPRRNGARFSQRGTAPTPRPVGLWNPSARPTGSRSDDFRTQDIYTLDLRLEKEFAATGHMGLSFGIDAFNVFNENYVLRRDLQLNGTRPNYLNETLSPRIFRLSVRLNWR